MRVLVARLAISQRITVEVRYAPSGGPWTASPAAVSHSIVRRNAGRCRRLRLRPGRTSAMSPLRPTGRPCAPQVNWASPSASPCERLRRSSHLLAGSRGRRSAGGHRHPRRAHPSGACGGQPAAGGREHDPQDRRPALNQRDVDRELPVAAEELLGPVERVDEPEGAIVRAYALGLGVLLGATIGMPFPISGNFATISSWARSQPR